MQSQLHSRRTIPIADRWIAPMVEKSAHRSRATRSNGAVQWSRPVHILGIRIGAGFNEAHNRRRLRRWIPPGRIRTSDCSRMKRFRATPILRAEVGGRLDQLVCHFLTIRGGGEM
jgi:hypothetical protein